ncbi:MAG: NAD-dependent succinate-semialdehyde dehydrogenase [Glaciecola sp.]|jgi:succinate-semialdehyde dehydrogenase/glutarate-semialdehyde dehydrogenase
MQLRDPSLIQTRLYIDGTWCAASNGHTFAVYDPATGEHITDVSAGTTQDAVVAIESAKRAFSTWRKTTAKTRSELLLRWYAAIIDNADDLAIIMTREQGKPLAEAKAEIMYAASFIQWFAEEAKRTYGDVIPTTDNGKRLLTYRQPVGVVSAITPWNFPSAMLTRKVAPALAAGCTFVIKPAEQTPLSAAALVVLAERVGVPAGVINLVTTDDAPAVGEVLSTHPDVAKLTFTGSTPVGKRLLAQASTTVKRVSMELGGNAPVLVFADADLDQAVAGVVASKYRNAGQTCICINRVLVEASVAEAFTVKLAAAVDALVVGNGFVDGVQIGPLISSEAKQKVAQLVDAALADGAELRTQRSMADILGNDVATEQYYPPTVLANVDTSMAVVQQEIFGPVAPVLTFEDEAEAIALANATRFGLAAYVFTEDYRRQWRVSEALEYGMIGMNDVAFTSEVIPFGGVKESGLGREGSKYGIDEYIETKLVCIGMA